MIQRRENIGSFEFGSEFKAPIKLKNLAISDDGHGLGTSFQLGLGRVF